MQIDGEFPVWVLRVLITDNYFRGGTNGFKPEFNYFFPNSMEMLYQALFYPGDQ